MATPWQILRDGGLPLAIEGTTMRRSPDELAAALRVAIEEAPQGREADALAAYVFAWHHHWERSFEEQLGEHAVSVLTWAEHAILDVNRYLKLRRIAIENLSTIL
jgi:hypothetical protein